MKRLQWTILLVAAWACRGAETKPDLARAAAPLPAVPDSSLPMPPGLDEAAMNTAVPPCEDFYEYACGGWTAKTEIPGDRPSWFRSFSVIEEENEKILRGILEDAAQGKPLPGEPPFAKKLGDFWAACTDEKKLETSLPELKAELRKVAAVRDPKSLVAAVAALQARGVHPMFEYRSAQDFKDATQVIGEFDQGGLGLPDRDYYVKDDPKTKAVRDAYRGHVKRMFVLLGDKPSVAESEAAVVLKIETALAKSSLTNVERRDPEKLYHRLDRKGLVDQAPGFAWEDFLRAVGTPDVQGLNVTHPPFFFELGSLVGKTPVAEWRTYLSWHVLRGAVAALPKRFQNEKFKFESEALTGAKEDLPRWKKCVELADEVLGEALAQPFIAKTFGTEGKEMTLGMVQEIERAFDKSLDTRPWMDLATRNKAKAKLKKIFNKIGFPDSWRSYDALQIDRTSFLGDLQRGRAFEVARDLGKIGKPLDRAEWLMTPPTVNAYYNAQLNEIVFPAGILQPPFWSRGATAAVNFGGMGMVVGHEVTHGFDDEGRHFDADGNMTEWWTPAAGKDFVARADCVKRQFDEEVAIEDIHVNGALTLGENVADLGGIKLAHAAMQEWVRKHPVPGAPKYRFNDAQQYFLGFAQSWCAKVRPESARLHAATDPHSPAFLRVNGPLRNLPVFQAAFACKEGSKMVRPKASRCEVW